MERECAFPVGWRRRSSADGPSRICATRAITTLLVLGVTGAGTGCRAGGSEDTASEPPGTSDHSSGPAPTAPQREIPAELLAPAAFDWEGSKPPATGLPEPRCTDLEADGSWVEARRSLERQAAAAGGAVIDGSYRLVDVVDQSPGPSATRYRRSLRISGHATRFEWVMDDVNGPLGNGVRGFGDLQVRGDTLVFIGRCGVVGGAFRYSTIGSTLVLRFEGPGVSRWSTYERAGEG